MRLTFDPIGQAGACRDAQGARGFVCHARSGRRRGGRKRGAIVGRRGRAAHGGDQPVDGERVRVARRRTLFAVTTWQTGDAIGVVGASCPAWTSGAAPRWDDHSQRNVPERCGSTAYEVWRVDRSSGNVHRLDVASLTAGNGYVATSVRGETVLLAGQGDGGGQVAARPGDSRGDEAAGGSRHGWLGRGRVPVVPRRGRAPLRGARLVGRCAAHGGRRWMGDQCRHVARRHLARRADACSGRHLVPAVCIWHRQLVPRCVRMRPGRSLAAGPNRGCAGRREGREG